MTAQQKKSGLAAFFARARKTATTEINEAAVTAEKVAQDVGRKVGATAAEVKHEVADATKKVQTTAKQTAKKATTSAKKTVKKAETAVNKAAKPVVSAVKVRTGTPDATWSLAELKDYAKNKGVTGYSSLNKTDLLALLKK
jgi:large subunit ribosomal protein L21